MKINRAALFAILVPAVAFAGGGPPPPSRTPRPASPPRNVHDAGPRTVGTHLVPHPDQPMHPVNNPPHQVIVHNVRTGHDENHVVVIDARPGHVIDRDPHLRVVVRGYRPAHDWGHFHMATGGWWRSWGISSWDTVGTVTCEAANEATGELFPVSEDRDRTGWDEPTVNLILDQALDDCMADGDANACTPTTPACSFQPY